MDEGQTINNKLETGAFHLFSTPIGTCAIAWRDGVIIGFQLPELSDREVLQRMQSKCSPGSATVPPPWVAVLIERIQNHLSGRSDPFADVPLCFATAPSFHKAVYELVRKIRPGVVRTYGDVARELGAPQAARAVGQAMGRNPLPLLVPCHRVVAANAKPGGFSAHGGLQTKAKMLRLEGSSYFGFAF